MKISIITICLNNEYLKRTILSVLNQTYKDFEFLIIDGGSTNNITCDTLKEFKNDYSVDITSEFDNGIYDAMNKGIQRSTGEYLIFLNAGDWFHSNKSLEYFIAGNDGFEIIYGDLEFINSEGSFVKEYPSKLTFSYFLYDSLPHPACFIKRSVFENVGLYDMDLQIVSDWALFITAICLYNVSYKHLHYIVSSFDHSGISSLSTSQPIVMAERNKYVTENFPSFTADYAELKDLKRKYGNFKNSRLRKYLAVIFKQLRIN